MNIGLISDNNKSIVTRSLLAISQKKGWSLEIFDQKKILRDSNSIISRELLVVDCLMPSEMDLFIRWLGKDLKTPDFNTKVIVFEKIYVQKHATSLAVYGNVSYAVAGESLGEVEDFLLATIGPDNFCKERILSNKDKWIAQCSNIASMVLIIDSSGNVLHVNSQYCEANGYDPLRNTETELDLFEVLNQSHVNYKAIWGVVSAGEIWSGRIYKNSKGAVPGWFETAIYPIFFSDSKPNAFVVIQNDITEQKEREDKLLRENERYSISHSCANIGSWDWNLETGELYWSEQIHALFGYKEPILKTSYQNFLNAIHPNDRPLVELSVKQCIEDDIPYKVEHRVVFPNGEVRWLSECGHTVKAKDGSVNRMVGVVSDIHALKQAELEVERQQKAKDAFINSLSHEIRNQLNAISGYGQIINKSLASSEIIKNAAKKVMISTAHIAEMLDDVLLNAKIEKGDVSISLKPVQIEGLVQLSIGNYEVISGKIALHVENISGCVLADEMRLKQVVDNLISNAIKYNRPNGWVKIYTKPGRGGALRLHVKDNGLGIPRDGIKRIFMPFERLGWKNTEIEGLGLGLSICKSLVSEMKGRIGVESRLGQGSDFWIELPKAHVAHNLSNTSSMSLSGNNELALKNVLVVEDSGFNQEVIAHHFSDVGITVTCANNGFEALKVLGDRTFDLIVTDKNMPLMGGLRFIEELDKDASLREVPILLITASRIDSELTEKLGCRVSAVLVKPFTSDELLNAASQACSIKNVVESELLEKEALSECSNAIDVDTLQLYIGNDYEKSKELAESYLVTLKENISLFKRESSVQEYDELAKAAHTLGASSLCMGARQLAKWLSALENNFKERHRKDSALIIAMIIEQAEQVKSELTRMFDL